ncbi:FHA domain-containing protein [Zavarzinia sp. CC-PAN008]|uniref:FHA domain-containing protein n=1 Tax=Zavarzinia sp. CC-PAN008 TaxID=3243332 RepID=UPI003F742DE7
MPVEPVEAVAERHFGRVFIDGDTRIGVEFVAPGDALACALALQGPLRGGTAGAVGIDLGDVQGDGDALGGPAVEQSLALATLIGSGVALSDAVFELADPAPELVFEDAGEKVLVPGQPATHVHRLSAVTLAKALLDASAAPKAAPVAAPAPEGPADSDATMVMMPPPSVSRDDSLKMRAEPEEEEPPTGTVSTGEKIVKILTFGLVTPAAEREAKVRAQALSEIESFEAIAADFPKQGKPYEAILRYDRALEVADAAPGLSRRVRQRVAQARRAVERSLFFRGPARIRFQGAEYYVHTGPLLQIGRDDGPAEAALAVPYTAISRLGRHAQIAQSGDGFTIEDVGSSNGTMLDGRLLATGEVAPLATDQVIALGGGKNPPRPGLARLKLRVVSGAYPALILQFQSASVDPQAKAQVAQTWPTHDRDVGLIHVMAPRGLQIGTSDACALRSKVRGWPSEAAAITLGPEGYTLSRVGKVALKVDGTDVAGTVALRNGASVKIDAIDLTIASA